jgi:PST family polysaccharide transporter
VTIIHRATAGAAWTIASSLLSRGVGVLGTLIMTRFLAPEVMGEVTTATVLAFTASWATQLGLTQYVMLRARGGPDPIFHATVMGVVLSSVALSRSTSNAANASRRRAEAAHRRRGIPV